MNESGLGHIRMTAIQAIMDQEEIPRNGMSARIVKYALTSTGRAKFEVRVRTPDADYTVPVVADVVYTNSVAQ